MKKKIIKEIRDKLIWDFWEENKAIWEMTDVAYMFGLSVPQLYRILREQNSKVENKTK